MPTDMKGGAVRRDLVVSGRRACVPMTRLTRRREMASSLPLGAPGVNVDDDGVGALRERTGDELALDRGEDHRAGP
jgi:hypothetical protein